jgi:hypothetical protein
VGFCPGNKVILSTAFHKCVPYNGTTHPPKQLENWLQERVRLNTWPLTIKVLWLPTNASWLDQIEIRFSVLQRKLLTPNHFNTFYEKVL